MFPFGPITSCFLRVPFAISHSLLVVRLPSRCSTFPRRRLLFSRPNGPSLCYTVCLHIISWRGFSPFPSPLPLSLPPSISPFLLYVTYHVLRALYQSPLLTFYVQIVSLLPLFFYSKGALKDLCLTNPKPKHAVIHGRFRPSS